MHKQLKYYTFFSRRVILILVMVMGVAGLAGCSGTYGRLVVNSDTKALFERNEVLPDYHYFHSGLAPHPRAIIGLHKDYTLQSDYWSPVDMTTEKLDRWLGFQHPNKKYLIGNNGLDILDSEDRKIGVWFGLKDGRDWSVIKMVDDRTVNISLPMPHTNIPRRYYGNIGFGTNDD
jgi:hypothetical protein